TRATVEPFGWEGETVTLNRPPSADRATRQAPGDHRIGSSTVGGRITSIRVSLPGSTAIMTFGGRSWLSADSYLIKNNPPWRSSVFCFENCSMGEPLSHNIGGAAAGQEKQAKIELLADFLKALNCFPRL